MLSASSIQQKDENPFPQGDSNGSHVKKDNCAPPSGAVESNLDVPETEPREKGTRRSNQLKTVGDMHLFKSINRGPVYGPHIQIAPVQAEHLRSYVHTPIIPLVSSISPLMSGFGALCIRESDENRNQVHDFQRYFVANRTRDIFRTTNVHVPADEEIGDPPPGEDEQQLDYMNQCDTLMYVDKEFEHPRSYSIRADDEEEKTLLKVTISAIDKVWNVENGALFADLAPGTVIGKIHFISSLTSFFTFVAAKDVLAGVPRLEMQSVGEEGHCKYSLRAAGVNEAVGGFEVRRYYYDVGLINCTREEAVLWLCILLAAELETKTPLMQFISDT